MHNSLICPWPCSNLALLDHLSLHSNDMRELTPAIGRCTALTWLSLNANKLQQLPPEIGQLTNLSRL